MKPVIDTTPNIPNTPTYDKLVDDVYDGWREVQCTTSEFFGLCNAQEQAAIVVCWLDTQVQNGGIMQWRDNGYSDFVVQTTDVLYGSGIAIAEEIAEKVNTFVQAADEIASDWSEDDELEHAYELTEPIAEKFDDWYYEVCNEFLVQFNTYLETSF